MGTQKCMSRATVERITAALRAGLGTSWGTFNRTLRQRYATHIIL
jgi:hypothetical protein